MQPIDLAARRLAAQGLVSPSITAPADIVRRLGAVQAQDFAGAKWALALRSRGLADADVERAFAAGELLRTHVLRPTWHFVAPEDIRWMLALTGPRIAAIMASYGRQLGLDATVYARSNAIIARALEGGKQLTRAELAEELRRAGLETTGTQRLARLVMQAEIDGVVCSGARRGRQFTYALLDERVPAMPHLDRDEALLALAARYFASRGPATPRDLAWWSGLTVTEATRAIAAAGSALERVEVDGVAYWMDPTVPGPPRRRRTPLVHLLPNYDEYFIGFKDRSAIGRRLTSVEIVTGGDALIGHVITVDGQLVGGWKRTPAEGGVVELRLMTGLTEVEERAVEAAVRAFGKFVGAPVEPRVLRAVRARSRKRPVPKRVRA